MRTIGRSLEVPEDLECCILKISPWPVFHQLVGVASSRTRLTLSVGVPEIIDTEDTFTPSIYSYWKEKNRDD